MTSLKRNVKICFCECSVIHSASIELQWIIANESGEFLADESGE